MGQWINLMEMRQQMNLGKLDNPKESNKQTNNGGNLRKWNKIPTKFKFKKVGQLHESEDSWRKMGTMDDQVVEVGPSKVVRQWMKLHILIGQSRKLGHWMNIGKLENPRK